jgi:hypothetical protein
MGMRSSKAHDGRLKEKQQVVGLTSTVPRARTAHDPHRRIRESASGQTPNRLSPPPQNWGEEPHSVGSCTLSALPAAVSSESERGPRSLATQHYL